METRFTWITFYDEFAKNILSYRDNIKPLLDFIYTLKDDKGKLLTSYIKDNKGEKVEQIDPFSVFAIFNRNTTWENRRKICLEFKQFLSLKSELPTDFSGIPTVDNRQSFFFDWDKWERITPLWDLFEKVTKNQPCEQEFAKVLQLGTPIGMLTMALYWIAPYSFLALDDRNKSFLQIFNIETKYIKTANAYFALIEQVKQAMQDDVIPYSSYPDFSRNAYDKSFDKGLWMWHGDYQTLQSSIIACGSSAQGKLEFGKIESREQMYQDFLTATKNTDGKIPDMYWQFMDEMKEGDTIVIFETKKDKRKQYHLLYGYGIIDGKCEITKDENPLQRKVVWHKPFLSIPIEERKTKNSLYLHKVTGIEAYNIRKLLQINMEVMKTKHSDVISLLEANRNLILTGAPGTGKTFMAKEIAEAMGAEWKMVQFHPSYDYTDFVEGIRPQEDKSFKRVDGEFKAFCKRALLAQSTGMDMLAELNNDPKVWKVSLMGTGDNEVRRDCLENGYIRIGWSRYGNPDDFFEYDNFFDGGKNVLRAFQSSMQIGDIVVSCFSEKETDAIGIITGDYEYREEGGDYPRYRTVKWITKNIRENIININGGKKFTLSTVYLSNIKPASALDIVKKYSTSLEHKTNKPFVFIIDEINRGEISKIFGELFFSIDPGYRGKDGLVDTQYQNMISEGDPFKEGFYVPENVYVIGTMNDIDRSVESMDFAMRRRFAWKEVTAAESYDAIITDYSKFTDAQKTEIKQRMTRLNAKIDDELGRAYQIGASYFLKLKGNDFEALWKDHLEGLLFEYFRGERDAKQKVEELHAEYNNE